MAGVLITADIHLSDNPRDEYRHRFMEGLLDTVRRKEISVLVVLGDLTEEKDRHNARLVNRLVGHFVELSKLLKIIILQGNHDWLTDADNAYFRFLANHENITWISKPTPLLMHDEIGWDPMLYGTALFLPHTHNHVRDWKKWKLGSFDWIFAHNLFLGATLESGMTGKEGIPTSVFPEGAKVIAGDVHNPQKVGPVTYVGAPYTIDFGDDYAPRMLRITEGGKLLSVMSKGPAKRLVEVESLDELPEEDGSFISEGDIVKVRYTLGQGEYSKWPDITKAITEWAARSKVTLDHIQPMISVFEKAQERKKFTKQSDDALLRRYAKARNVDESTLKVGLKLLRNA